MESCLQQSRVSRDFKDYDLRYFYVDEGGIGRYTCGVAFESMMTLLRKYRFDFDLPSCLIGLHFTQDEKAGGHGLAEVMKQRKGSPLHECMLHYKIYEILYVSSYTSVWLRVRELFYLHAHEQKTDKAKS